MPLWNFVKRPALPLVIECFVIFFVYFIADGHQTNWKANTASWYQQRKGFWGAWHFCCRFFCIIDNLYQILNEKACLYEDIWFSTSDTTFSCFPHQINGPIVLQIQKVRNVSAPTTKEDSSFAPRMLKFTLTDGVITCSGIEIEIIHSVRWVCSQCFPKLWCFVEIRHQQIRMPISWKKITYARLVSIFLSSADVNLNNFNTVSKWWLVSSFIKNSE